MPLGQLMKILTTILFLVLAVSAQLRFDAALHQHVQHGEFYEVSVPNSPITLSPDFAWEAWVKIDPTLTQGYFLSASYGGAHPILAGFTGDGVKYSLLGNLWLTNGGCPSQGTWSFGTPAVFYPNIWYHVAVSSRNRVLTIYKDGIPVAQQTWTGDRLSSTCGGYDFATGGLFIGGSDHLNFSGSIASVRGWEGYSPYKGTPFTPELSFRGDWLKDDLTMAYASFLADYTQRATIYPDLSNGYRGKTHSGRLMSAIYGLSPGRPTRSGPILPQWENDPTYPVWGTNNVEPVGQVPTPTSTITDTFTRAESSTLGQTETGQTWTSNVPFGIQNEKGVALAPGYYGSALVDIGSSTHTVAVSRGLFDRTGLRIRSVDFNNGYAVFIEFNTVYLFRIVNGANTMLGSCAVPNGWQRIKAVSGKGSITVYVDNALKFTYNGTLSEGANVGLYQYSPDPMGYEDFTAD